MYFNIYNFSYVTFKLSLIGILGVLFLKFSIIYKLLFLNFVKKKYKLSI